MGRPVQQLKVLGANPRLAWTNAVGVERPGQLIVCEGIPDALTAAGAGYAAVAVLGSKAPGFEVAGRIATSARRTGYDVVAVVDNDASGRAAGERLHGLLGEFGVDLAVVVPPGSGMDLNSWATANAGWSASDALQRSSTDGFAEHPSGHQIEVG